jgi:hypothetical protein
MRDGESDEFKRVLIEGNPFFLGLTFFVSLLHSAFDVLAFKNDIGFWRNKKSVEGLSVRTIIFNCACQVSLAEPQYLWFIDSVVVTILASMSADLMVPSTSRGLLQLVRRRMHHVSHLLYSVLEGLGVLCA